MTIEELKQLRPLVSMIEHEVERLEDLRAAAGVRGANLDGMPRAPGPHDKIGALVPEIIDQEEKVVDTIRQCARKINEIRNFIESIPDIRVKLICILRFEEGLPWEDVADRIGGRETSYSCKHAAYRYLQRLEKNNVKEKQKADSSTV